MGRTDEKSHDLIFFANISPTLTLKCISLWQRYAFGQHTVYARQVFVECFAICIDKQMKQEVDVNKVHSRLAGSASRAVGISSNHRNWYIAMVRNNTEKISCQKLRALGYEVFLPIQEEVSIWKDGRKKKRDRILLPGLVLIRLTEKQRKEVVNLPYINKFMVNHAGAVNSYNRHPIAVVPNEQIERLRFMLGDKSSTVNIEPLNLKIGEKVRIICGNLRGLEGNVYQNSSGNSYIVIRLENLCCASVRVSLEEVALV